MLASCLLCLERMSRLLLRQLHKQLRQGAVHKLGSLGRVGPGAADGQSLPKRFHPGPRIKRLRLNFRDGSVCPPQPTCLLHHLTSQSKGPVSCLWGDCMGTIHLHSSPGSLAHPPGQPELLQGPWWLVFWAIVRPLTNVTTDGHAPDQAEPLQGHAGPVP